METDPLGRSEAWQQHLASERKYGRLITIGCIIHAVILAALVVWANLATGCVPGAAAGSGILRVSCTDNGNASLIKQLEYSIDGGSQHLLGEGDSLQHWLDVGNHRLIGRVEVWWPSGYCEGCGSGSFDEQVYIWDAGYGETTWSR